MRRLILAALAFLVLLLPLQVPGVAAEAPAAPPAAPCCPCMGTPACPPQCPAPTPAPVGMGAVSMPAPLGEAAEAAQAGCESRREPSPLPRTLLARQSLRDPLPIPPGALRPPDPSGGGDGQALLRVFRI